MATFSRVKTWVSNETLTASDLNAEFDNIITNMSPSGIEDASATISAMQQSVDPGGVGSESLATSLLGEIHRLRFAIKRLCRGAQWYSIPALVDTSDIEDDAITEDKIANDAVTENKIKNDSVTENKIKDNAVTENKIKDDAVTKNKIKDGEVPITWLSGIVRPASSFFSAGNMQSTSPQTIASVSIDTVATASVRPIEIFINIPYVSPPTGEDDYAIVILSMVGSFWSRSWTIGLDSGTSFRYRLPFNALSLHTDAGTPAGTYTFQLKISTAIASTQVQWEAGELTVIQR